MKINTETSRSDRLRVVVGSILSVAGIFIALGPGAMVGYNQTLFWVAGFLLILSGIFIAKSVALANFLNNVLRF